MKRRATYWIWSLAFFAGFLPLVASAHALPVSSSPASSAVVAIMPKEVSITFSEHVDKSVSDISVTAPSGQIVSKGTVTLDASHYIMSTEVEAGGSGAYLVSWTAISADDGHVTQGAFPFIVGSGSATSTQTFSSTITITEISSTPEALGSAVELAGNGIIWAVLILFTFGARKLLTSGRFKIEETFLHSVYRRAMYSGIFLACTGGIMQLVVKAGELASLRTPHMQFADALVRYIGTAAGIDTVYRLALVAIFFCIFVYGNKVILRSQKYTWYEAVLFLLMSVFAYYRAVISHVVEVPLPLFLPVGVNMLHLVATDFLFGASLLLVLLSVSSQLRAFLIALLPRAFVLLSGAFLVLSVTASFIVWVLLKNFSNLFTTNWGSAFLILLVPAFLLLVAFSVQIFLWFRMPESYRLHLPKLFAVQCALALMVVYLSSVMIVTSPPATLPPLVSFSSASNGVTITAARDPYEDGMVLITLAGNASASTTSIEPAVTIEDKSTTAGPVSIALQKRFAGGYVFPQALFIGNGPFELSITEPQQGSYDAHAVFSLVKNTFAVPKGWSTSMPLNGFALAMLCIALCGVLYWVLLLYFLSRKKVLSVVTGSRRIGFTSALSFTVTAVACALAVSFLASSSLLNPFKAECESDGNVWHLMQPSKAGVAVSQTIAEGCMWGMGDYMYLFPDKREYDYYRTPSQAIDTLTTAPTQLVAGVPATLTAKLSNADGTPADLFVDMDKLLHVVIISKDETVFAHIHADDVHPLTLDEINNSTFTLNYTFPKAGTYLVSFDYAHGLQLESKQFTVQVSGAPAQSETVAQYPEEGNFDGYDVALKYALPIAGNIETMQYTITKDGQPVTTIVPYLSAAMHVSVVKNDLSWFLHVHGEVHPAGTPLPPLIIKNGQVMHTMAMMNVPDTFGPNIEAHVIFPTAGEYTVWGEFKVGDKVIPTSFTVRVEE